MSDRFVNLLVLLGAGLTVAGVMAAVNAHASRSPSLKVATFFLLWIGLVASAAALVGIAIEAL